MDTNPLTDLQLFDCYCMVGRETANPSPWAITEADVLLSQMQKYGISETLVTHFAVREDSPIRGNALTVAFTAGNNNLHPAWSILPPQTDEMGSIPEFLTAMQAADVRALWAFPANHRYVLNSLTFGPLFEELSARRIPLFIKADWELLHRLLPEFPNLTVVAVEHGCWGDDRYFRPLIERFPRFYLDISRYELAGGIVEICRRYGSARLLFSTGFPQIQIGGTILSLLHAEIDDSARRAIAGGNLRRLLGEVCWR